MKFLLQERKLDRLSGNTWTEPGVYEFVRIFDADRYLINTTVKGLEREQRQLTIVKKTDGLLLSKEV